MHLNEHVVHVHKKIRTSVFGLAPRVPAKSASTNNGRAASGAFLPLHTPDTGNWLVCAVYAVCVRAIAVGEWRAVKRSGHPACQSPRRGASPWWAGGPNAGSLQGYEIACIAVYNLHLSGQQPSRWAWALAWGSRQWPAGSHAGMHACSHHRSFARCVHTLVRAWAGKPYLFVVTYRSIQWS